MCLGVRCNLTFGYSLSSKYLKKEATLAGSIDERSARMLLLVYDSHALSMQGSQMGIV